MTSSCTCVRRSVVADRGYRCPQCGGLVPAGSTTNGRSKAGWIVALCLGGVLAVVVIISIVLFGLRAQEPIDSSPTSQIVAAAPAQDDVQAQALADAIKNVPDVPPEQERLIVPVELLTPPPLRDVKFIVPVDQASFMGVQAKGRRFCIIADASNSMRGSPLTQLKSEMLKTLGDLKSSSEFYIIFFNATDIPMPYPNWLSATKENKEKVTPWIQGMGTVLKTQPSSAFKRAFQLSPRPDVIFFMTDGLIPASVPGEVARLNAASPKVTVHTIQFHKANPKAKAKEANAEDQLRKMAEASGGTFRHFKNAP